jgi:hypothetical protein
MGYGIKYLKLRLKLFSEHVLRVFLFWVVFSSPSIIVEHAIAFFAVGRKRVFALASEPFQLTQILILHVYHYYTKSYASSYSVVFDNAPPHFDDWEEVLYI